MLARALAYPYEVPHTAYRLVRGGVRPAPARLPAPHPDRVVMLAAGSNAAPSALARKLVPPDDAPDVLVVPAVLRDADVVYSAHVTLYGAIPATIARVPGARAPVHLVVMSAAQEERVITTEGNYSYVTLLGARIEVAGEPVRVSPRAFVSRHGLLDLGAGPVGLAERAGRSPLPRMGQREVLAELAARMGRRSPEDFVLEVHREPALRRRANAMLRGTAADPGFGATGPGGGTRPPPPGRPARSG